MRILDIEIEGYKSIRNQHLSPQDLTVLIGKNNSGKSNIIDLLIDFQEYFDKDEPGGEWHNTRVFRGEGVDDISIGVHFRLNDDERGRLLNNVNKSMRGKYSEENWLREVQAYRNFQESGLENDVRVKIADEWIRGEDLEKNPKFTGYFANEVRELVKSSIESWRFVSPFRKPSPTAAPAKVDRLDSTGENLVRALESLRSSPRQDIYNKICDTYVEIMENVEGLSIEYDPASTQSILTIFVEENGFKQRFKADEISSGSMEILILLTQILSADQSTDLLAIEEPELHLHPGAEKRLFEIISDLPIAGGPQVIMTTHSEVFVDHSRVDNIVSVIRDRETELRDIESESEHVELLGYEQSDLVQSDVVLFVEGRSDQIIMKQFARILGTPLEDYGIQVIVGGGDQLKADAPVVTNVLDQLRIPYRFLLDSDGKDSDEKAKEVASSLGVTPRDVIVLQEYCIESYLLSSPKAIAQSINESVDEVENFLQRNGGRNPEGTLTKLYKEYLGMSYHKKSHGAQIVKHMSSDQIEPEIEKIVQSLVEIS